MVVQIKKRKHNAKADSNDIQSCVEDFGQKYHCDSCSKDITHLIIIRCADCEDFDLCLDCFCKGTELKDHKKTHAYRVIDVLDFCIFEKDWGADEEILLVEGLEQFGLGNWETIAELIGTKNALQVARHYDQVFVQSKNWPYPDLEDNFDMRPGKRPRARGPNYVVQKLPKCPRPPASQPVNHDIAGYMPGRKEFEYDYENDADQIVKDIEFLPEDTPEDTALKCAVLQNYNTILDRRLYRKSFIFERNLTEFRKIQNLEKKKTKDERDLFQKYRVFAKFQTAADFEVFMQGQLNEMRLRHKIAQYQEYQRMGIRTLKEASDYERHKANRANKSINLTHLDKTGVLKRSNSVKDDNFEPSPSSTPLRVPSALLPLSGIMPTRKPAINPLDITEADGVELLSDIERAICMNLRMYPKAYMSIKDIVLKEFALKGPFKRKAMRSLVKIDVQKSSKLFDFFLEQGWISNKAQ